MCGGTVPVDRPDAKPDGLSPRVRGNRTIPSCWRSATRSIPACAGEPFLTLTLCRHSRVYPRVCGGTLQVFVNRRAVIGLSPRVRGNPG